MDFVNFGASIKDIFPLLIRYYIYLAGIALSCFLSGIVMSQTIDSNVIAKQKEYFQDFILLDGQNVFIKKYDTTLNGFQIDNLILKKSFANLYIGNLGLAVKGNMVDKNINPLKLNYGQNQFSVYDFGISPGFIRNKKIFTSLSYSRGTKKEQYFIINHRQKIANNAMAGLDFAVGASQGFYLRQLTGIRNFDLFGIYETRNSRYRLYGKFIYNKISAQENGGLTYDSSLIGVSGANSKTLVVRLDDADRLHKEKIFYFQQQLYIIQPKIERMDSTTEKLGLDFSLDLTHAFQFNDKGMIFQSATIHDDYFSNIYYDSTTTFDSTHIRSYFNDFKVNLSINNLVSTDHLLDGDFFLGANQQNFKINQRELDTVFNDLTAYAGVKLKFLEMAALTVSYSNSINSTIKGGRKFETDLNYKAFNDFLFFRINFRNENKIPELFSLMNFSNHYRWLNSYKNENHNRVTFGFDLPWLNFKSGLTYLVIKNYVFYNAEGLPGQYAGTIKNLSFAASHQLNYKKFHLVNKVLFEETNNKSIVQVPEFSSYHSIFCEISFFKKVLLTQFGTDARYNSAFYSPYYQPATGEFNFQNETKFGGYLFLDVFVNFKVKTARFFFKVEHVNKGWSKKSYILLAHYPMQGRMLKFGVTWNMFD